MTFVENLRAIADWYEARPDVPTPFIGQMDVFCYTKEELAVVARKIGASEKRVTEAWFYLVKTIGNTEIHFNLAREEACIRRVVGTRDEPAKLIPARTVEIVEWDCAPILGETEP